MNFQTNGGKPMTHGLGTFRPILAAAVGTAVLFAAGCSSTDSSEAAGKGQTVKTTLSGDNEFPP
jgi:hypothetical protein